MPGSNGRVLKSNGVFQVAIGYVSGYGLLYSAMQTFELNHKNNINCFMRNGVSVYGYPIISIGEEQNAEQSFSIYPQPADQQLGLKGEGIKTARIYDCLGKKVYSAEFDPATKISTSGFENGVYLLSIERHNGQTINAKVLVFHN